MLLALALVGCQEETKTAESWAISYVLEGHDTTLIEPLSYTVESATCDLGEYPEDTDFEYYACFVVRVQHDLDGDATERSFAVIVAWEKTFWMRALQSRGIPESAITDIDEVEIKE
jgi:hypothetical protein